MHLSSQSRYDYSLCILNLPYSPEMKRMSTLSDKEGNPWCREGVQADRTFCRHFFLFRFVVLQDLCCGAVMVWGFFTGLSAGRTTCGRRKPASALTEQRSRWPTSRPSSDDEPQAPSHWQPASEPEPDCRLGLGCYWTQK